MFTIILEQFATEKTALKYCKRIIPSLKKQLRSKKVKLAVNQIDGNCFNIELILEKDDLPEELDITLLD